MLRALSIGAPARPRTRGGPLARGPPRASPASRSPQRCGAAAQPEMRFHTHDVYFWHVSAGGVDPDVDPTPHWDDPDTKRRCARMMEHAGMLSDNGGPLLHDAGLPRPATREELQRVHTAAYVDEVAATAGKWGAIGEEAYFGPRTFDIASRAAGACIDALARVLRPDAASEERLSYVLCRPPGHHAMPGQAQGFCIFSNVAVAVAAALATGAAKRVAIVDVDVHHGNGTQRAFYGDPRVLFVSLHQSGCYPQPVEHATGRARHHGALEERGEGDGAGTTVNIPLPPGSGGGAYRCAWDRIVDPALRRFGPCDAVVVSAGIDAGAFDPLARMGLTGNDFYDLGCRLRALAEELAGGRLLAVHEGGYSPMHTPYLCLRFIEGLLSTPGQPFTNPAGVKDPFQAALDMAGPAANGLHPHQEEAVTEVARTHGLA